MADGPQRSWRELRERIRPDFGTVLFVALVVLLLFWITAELWLPHWGSR